MKPLDYLKLSLRQLRERKLRSILTIFAVAVGVATIVALSAQAEGVSGAILQNLSKLGPDVLVVSVRGNTQFNEADVARLKELDGIASVNPMIMAQVRVTGIEAQVNLVGLSSVNLNSILGEVKIMDGSMFLDVPAPQALIGSAVAMDDAGQTRYSVNQPLLLQVAQRTMMLTVTGVMESYGSSPLIQPDAAIFIPLDYMKMFTRVTGYNFIVVRALSVDDVEAVSQLLTSVFGGRASVTSIKQVSQTVTGITSQISALLFGIAGTSFIAAGLGTFNIMMVSVLERIREIGILKSLGMRDEGVLTLYVSQGVLIGVLGSVTGLALGLGLAYALPSVLGGINFGGINTPRIGPGQATNVMTSYSPIITPDNLLLATVLSLIVTLVSSAYPAWRASKLRPVEALRYD